MCYLAASLYAITSNVGTLFPMVFLIVRPLIIYVAAFVEVGTCTIGSYADEDTGCIGSKDTRRYGIRIAIGKGNIAACAGLRGRGHADGTAGERTLHGNLLVVGQIKVAGFFIRIRSFIIILDLYVTGEGDGGAAVDIYATAAMATKVILTVVSSDGATVHMKGTTIHHYPTALFLGLIASNGATVHIESAVIPHRNSGTGCSRTIAGNRTAVHDKGAGPGIGTVATEVQAAAILAGQLPVPLQSQSVSLLAFRIPITFFRSSISMS